MRLKAPNGLSFPVCLLDRKDHWMTSSACCLEGCHEVSSKDESTRDTRKKKTITYISCILLAVSVEVFPFLGSLGRPVAPEGASRTRHDKTPLRKRKTPSCRDDPEKNS